MVKIAWYKFRVLFVRIQVKKVNSSKLKIPRNVASVIQFMDQGVIERSRCLYKKAPKISVNRRRNYVEDVNV